MTDAMEDAAPMLEYNEAPLKPEQIEQIESVVGPLQDALAKLGEAYQENQRAYTIYRDTVARLKECEGVVDLMQQQHDDVLAMLAKSMDLPPGEWTYNRANGMLKKD